MTTAEIETTMRVEEYRALLARIRNGARTRGEARRRILEIVAEKAKKRDVGDFDSGKVLRNMREGEISY